MQRADDALARGSVPDESNKPKGLGDASQTKAKGKVDPIDKKAEKKRIAARAKADLKAGRVPAFRIGGTYEVLPSDAPVAQNLGILPPALLPINSDSPELDRQNTRGNTWEISAAANRQSTDDYAAKIKTLKEEKQKLEEEVKKRDVNLEVASAKMMVEAEYELPPGLLENYVKEEKEYLAQVESFDVDSIGDDTLFPSLPPPPVGPPRDIASQVPEGISEHESFLLSQDRQDGDQV
ncbi:hypothetical protein AALP_AA8G268800 [Arabis alpina]|uniref:Uncharacterized protein n=1 Tax=Arabis alpina TaxID=50452 RepID=A0A087G9P0_ARAAL|nr:hypothetical protein AALP_AA8G268800 [Arabis alpina]